MAGNQEFDTPQDALAHYGKKGMKWGVRKDRDEVGNDRSGSKPEETDLEKLMAAQDAYYAERGAESIQNEGKAKMAAKIADPGFPTKRQSKAIPIEELSEEYGKDADRIREAIDNTKPGFLGALERNAYRRDLKIIEKTQGQLDKKAEALREGKLTPGQKKAIIGAGAAVAAAGLLYYGNKRLGEIQRTELAENREQTNAQWKSLFGKDYPHSTQANPLLPVSGDAVASFYAGLSNKKAYLRPEFLIPEGTVFQRLSNHPEDSTEYGQKKGAYATFLSNDKKIYGSSMEFGGSKYNVNFKADGPVRVPTLKTVLAHMKQINKMDNPDTPSRWDDKVVAADYQQMAGGSWSDSRATRLFDSLRSHGYGAIVDDMDAGYLGDLPVVFFGKGQAADVTERTGSQRIHDSYGIMNLAKEYS